MWDTVALFAGASGILATFLALVRIAISTERRRADDWREAARTTTAANEVLSANVGKLITTAEQQSTSLREVLTLLQKLAADRGITP